MQRPLSAVLLLLTATASACAHTEQASNNGVGESVDCSYMVRYAGHVYEGNGVRVAPQPATRIGTGVTIRCPGHVQHVPVAAIPGVDPAVALSVPGTNDQILLRDGVTDPPPAVKRLLHARTCAIADSPLLLDGPWVGIIDADGHTETDMVPPYNLQLLVAHASSPRYLRAFLSVRVPPALGTPLTEDDVHTWLWHPGTLSIAARCMRGHYIAEQVSAQAPG
jgi:hypothetical protein